MRFIELHECDSGAPFLVNVSRLNLMYRYDDKTILRIDGNDIGVKETPDEILIKIRG
jgi:hypothetical protein